MPAADFDSRSETAGPETAPSNGAIRRLRPDTVFLILLLAAAFAVRLWPLSKVHFWDETAYLQNAEVICCGKINYSELDIRPPLLSLLFAGVFQLWHSAYAASILTALLNALGALFLYLAGRKIVGRTAAAIAALLLAFSPFLVSGVTGNSLHTDCPALTLILISFWLLLPEADQADGWFAAAGLVSALAVLMRFASLPSIAVLSLLVLRANRWIRAALRFGAGFALGIVPYLLWSQIRYGGFLTTLNNGWENVGGSAEPKLYYLRNFGQVYPWITLAGIVLWLVGWFLDKHVAWGRVRGQLFTRLGRPENEDAGGLDVFLWVWVLAVLLYFSALSHKELRYILPLSPPLFLLAGYGLTVLLRGRTLKMRLVGTTVLVVLLCYSFAPVLDRFHGPFVSPFISEEKEVSDFLNNNARIGAVLYANFNYPVFGYYTHLPTHIVREQDAGFYKVFPKNMPADGYLILYKQVDKDPRLDWVESNPHFRHFQDFPSLVVFEYRVSGN